MSKNNMSKQYMSKNNMSKNLSGSKQLSEHDIEQMLVKAVRKAGGMCPKLISPGTDGMPDRLVLLPGGMAGYVEVKAPGRKPRPLQVKRHRQMRELGHLVYVLDDPDQIQMILDDIRKMSCGTQSRGTLGNRTDVEVQG